MVFRRVLWDLVGFNGILLGFEWDFDGKHGILCIRD